MTSDVDRLASALQAHRALARLVLRLDDALGLHHGLSWSDLLLLDALREAGGGAPLQRAAAVTGRSPSALLRQVLPLEKVGLVQREPQRPGVPRAGGVTLTAGGARVLREAHATAREVLEGHGVPDVAA